MSLGFSSSAKVISMYTSGRISFEIPWAQSGKQKTVIAMTGSPIIPFGLQKVTPLYAPKFTVSSVAEDSSGGQI
jgi:hypothetical protein